MPLGLCLGLFVSATVWFVDALRSDVDAAGFASIDPRRARLASASPDCDPRWNDMLAARLAQWSSVSALDTAAIQNLADEIALLPFVEEVGEPSVLWPDGLDVPLRLRTPVACIRARSEYYAVSADGVILPGSWPAPPKFSRGFLPVLGPNDGAFDLHASGERLREDRHLDALRVALSMRSAFSAEEFEILGPVVIDATTARAATVTEPGVRLLLEGRRLVLFGRPPSSLEPGELPADFKWAALKRALARLVDPRAPRDWSLVDVRWDKPDIHWRDAPAAND